MTSLPDPTLMEDLIARLEKATGPDRELDAEIWCAARGYRFMNHTSRQEAFIYWHGTRQFRGEAERLTASLDAALALVERAGPKGIDAAQLLHEALEALANGGWRDDAPIAPQIALSLLTTTLRALSSAYLRVKS